MVSDHWGPSTTYHISKWYLLLYVVSWWSICWGFLSPLNSKWPSLGNVIASTTGDYNGSHWNWIAKLKVCFRLSVSVCAWGVGRWGGYPLSTILESASLKLRLSFHPVTKHPQVCHDSMSPPVADAKTMDTLDTSQFWLTSAISDLQSVNASLANPYSNCPRYIYWLMY